MYAEAFQAVLGNPQRGISFPLPKNVFTASQDLSSREFSIVLPWTRLLLEAWHRPATECLDHCFLATLFASYGGLFSFLSKKTKCKIPDGFILSSTVKGSQLSKSATI